MGYNDSISMLDFCALAHIGIRYVTQYRSKLESTSLGVLERIKLLRMLGTRKKQTLTIHP